MSQFDVFNGDADGICALRQLRLADPADSVLVTGLKRDIALLERVEAGEGDTVTVLDLSIDRNRPALERLLARGARVRYIDHHEARDIPAHERLRATIDCAPGTCTSAIVDRELAGRFRAWAVAGAFGDNQAETAHALAGALGLGAEATAELAELGANLNYNAYGERESDVLIAPADLYRVAARYSSPFDLAVEPVVARLGRERREDLERASRLQPHRRGRHADAYLLPDEAWSRRVSGTFANRLARDDPSRAHAVIAPLAAGGFVLSVRTPRASGVKAAELCRRFGTGGGRAIAAGIDRLEGERLEEFFAALEAACSAAR